MDITPTPAFMSEEELERLQRLERYCDACGHQNEEDEIERVGPLGQGSWVCGRCLTLIYGVDRPKEEVFELLWAEKP